MHVPEFGICDLVGAYEEIPGRHEIIADGHTLPTHLIAGFLQGQNDVLIRLDGWFMRMEYVCEHLDLARSVFPLTAISNSGFGDDYLVIHVRLGDVLSGRHKDYWPLPIAWYETLINQSARSPVFVGEFGDDAYSCALRDRFSSARFIRHDDAVQDFNILRTSTNIVLSISSFSWMAAWLSLTAQKIYLPIAGLFNCLERPDIDLLPISDRRYRFFLFEKRQQPWQALPEQIDEAITSREIIRELSEGDLRRFRAASGP